MGVRDIDGVSKLGVFFRASAEELVRAADDKSIFDGIDWRIHGRNEITGAVDQNRCFIRILIGVITLRSEMRAWPSWLIVPGYGGQEGQRESCHSLSPARRAAVRCCKQEIITRAWTRTRISRATIFELKSTRPPAGWLIWAAPMESLSMARV